MESIEIHVLRNMAWERAKGEMNSMLQTYYNENNKFKGFKEAYKNFVSLVEDNGLQE